MPGGQVERAIDLSREKYCSVWHSMRQDIELTVTFKVTPAPLPACRTHERRERCGGGYLDWLRGIAVLIMIEAHVLDSWTRRRTRATRGRSRGR